MSSQYSPEMLPRNMSAKIVPGPGGCWLFTGATNSRGYGLTAIDGNGSTRLAHRAAYQLLVGPVPEGRIVYHTCAVRRCCNPEHLVAAYPKQAMAHVQAAGRAVRSVVAETNAAKLACKRGHAFSPENTILDSRGHRTCRECKRMKDREACQRRAATKA
jgi:hypothetical protein